MFVQSSRCSIYPRVGKKMKLMVFRRCRMGGVLFSEIKAYIEATDREIDQMVYALYDLTEKEIEMGGGVVFKLIS